MSARADPPNLTIRPLAESGLLIELDDKIDRVIVARVAALTAALDDAALPGVLDIVPAYTTILISFDPVLVEPDELALTVRRLAATEVRKRELSTRHVTIPVAYGGDFGPDLESVAEHTRLPLTEVIARHAAADYVVACMGFAPGFAFLVGLPPELATPRLAAPRTRVPAGGVGIGGIQTGVYSLETPGGWSLIGRTPLRMFDPQRPEPFLLQTGENVRFEPITHDEFRRLDDAEVGGSYEPPIDPPSVLPSEAPTAAESKWAIEESSAAEGVARLVVREPGLLTTVQDLGRSGMARFGVASGGALDRGALMLGNRLVGNDPSEAGLEITLVGPTLAFTGHAVIALTGADLGATLDGDAMPRWQPVSVTVGTHLSFAGGAGADGARAYLCVAGGFALEPVLGSRSTDLVGGFGGVDGRPLRTGDELPMRGTSTSEALFTHHLASTPPAYSSALAARVVLGPQVNRFTAQGVATFLGHPYTVSGKADRTGLRLVGPSIETVSGADLISEGIHHGAIQVPGDGQPIVLLAARQTVGGYVKIATVIGADLDAFGQLLPGQTVTFSTVEPAEARVLSLAYRAGLGEDALVTIPQGFTGWTPTAAVREEEDSVYVGNIWNPAGVVRLIEALKQAQVTNFQLEVAAVGLRLELRRGADDDRLPEPAERPELAVTETSLERARSEERAAQGEVVKAPVLGVFHRRSGPDEPPLAEVGQLVEAGQVLAVLEVMKSYHEVTAPRPGVLTAFLVEDGQFVEYGQPIARLTPRETGSTH